jgi:uncharacterized membrane protein YbhN (UPF0104 family)
MASLRRIRSRPPRWLVAGLSVLAIVGLVVGAVLAWRSLPAEQSIDWWIIVGLALLGAPVSVALLTEEVRLCSRVAGVELDRSQQAYIAVVGSAANLLPLPGSAMLRLGALRRAGSGTRLAAVAVAVVPTAWVGIAFVLAGVAVVPRAVFAVAFLAIGAAIGSGAAVVVLRQRPDRPRRVLGEIAIVESSFVLLSSVRLWLCFTAMDEPLTIRGAIVLALSGAVAAAIGFVPSGIGVREGLVALLASLAGVPANVALVAAVLDRIAALAGNVPVAVAILVWRRRQSSLGARLRFEDHEVSDESA